MTIPDAKRLKELEAGNTRLKKRLAEQMFENDIINDALRKKVVSASARRTLVRHLVDEKLSERRVLAAVRMSASVLRYTPRWDRSVKLRERILVLAQRATHYGVGMIYLQLRQEQWLLNYKGVERL